MPHMAVSARRCTGCRLCELACSAWHEGAYQPSVARLIVDVNPSAARVRGRTCLQTDCAKCEAACPEGAIERYVIEVKAFATDPVLGYVLRVDEGKCTNCGECYAVCPMGVIWEHPGSKVATKCELCNGEPQCLAFCQNPAVMAVSVRANRADRALERT